ncbi:glycine oxidase ThiO [Edaphobacter acidisoli]|uniref:Glycine oxidase ThiO n=1 Tax=Edaphobacter acidisoli TaxID=2040573 RepID=A0A916RZX1_9BACT|nr:FAD-dependent oxidoreductase [Edaphobacter acidisoli]GGA78586.1 glycine oxidase ThiO [Edaphobacter acidisoli]
MQHSDICIAGAGIIGLSLALELHHRGARITVLEQAMPLGEASTAAAGMLAAADPDNPPALRPLSDLSISLYPSYLTRLRDLSGLEVPLHTSRALQALPEHMAETSAVLSADALRQILPQLTPGNRRFVLLDEHSLDPRQLATALLAAVRATTIELRTQTKFLSAKSSGDAVEIQTAAGTVHASQFVDCTGAWSTQTAPKKGQMLAVALPASLPLATVVRTPDIYIVPRAAGPKPTRAIIGATVEDAGFDKTVHPADIARLKAQATSLLPQLADATLLESWAGLRPVTADHLPLLGATPSRTNHFIAAGHYRNGILLAPATAHVMAQLLTGETPAISLSPYSPSRVL